MRILIPDTDCLNLFQILILETSTESTRCQYLDFRRWLASSHKLAYMGRASIVASIVQKVVNETRKLSYRKDARAMRPMYGMGALKIVGVPDYAHGYFSQKFNGLLFRLSL